MSILKSILHRYNTTNQNYDTLHPETEHAQVTDFGNGVLAHLLDSTLVSAVNAVSTGSLFGKLVEKLLEASGVQYNFQNSNAWYICLGSLFGGLIIQGGVATPPSAWTTVSYSITFNSAPVVNANYIAALENTVLRHVKISSISTSGFRAAVIEGSNYTDSSICWRAVGK